MEKDNKDLINSQKDTQFNEAISGVLKDNKAVYLYKKAEKICRAMFMITNVADGASDVANYKYNVIIESIRKTSLGLVEVTSFIISSGHSIGQSENLIKDAIVKIMSLISMSEIAVAGKVISEPHLKIVKYQMELLVIEMHAYLKTLIEYEEGTLSSSLFEVSDIVSNMNMRTNMSNVSNASNIKNLNTINTNTRIKSEQSFRPTTDRSNNVGIENKSDNKNERQKTILDTIRSRGESSIKDLVNVIKGCSEKTIQRELISLVQTGVLSKTGERRWSRYSVVN